MSTHRMRPRRAGRALPTLGALAAALLAGAGLHACRDAEASVALDAPVTLSAPTTVGAAPIVAIAGDGRRALAWVSAPEGGTDGRLYVAVDTAPPVEIADPLGPIEAHGEAPPKLAWGADGALHALYVVGKLVPGRRFPAGALRHVRSTDGGRSWTVPHAVTDAAEFGSYNFHALHAAPDGTLYAAWLDGRHGKSATYLTSSTDGGASWAPNVRVAEGESCPCCRTALAADSSGAVWVGWRAVLPGGIRDIVVARSSDRGRTWAAPVRVHEDDWQFDGCPHAGPALLADADGALQVAWWTGKEGAAGVYTARSTDGGRSFGPRVALGAAEFSRPAHVQLARAGHAIVAAWDDGTLEVPQVQLRVSRDAGRSFGPTVAASEAAVAASFPVLAAHGDHLTIAWTQQTPASLAAEAHHRPNMRDPKAVMPLPRVGDKVVLVREGRLR